MANITIVATGGTRAPTQIELASRFLSDGHQVRCIATRAALRFLTSHMARRPRSIPSYVRRFRPQLLETLAYYAETPKSVPHISEGKWGDVFVMCPASCNSVGKLAAGIGDNYALQVLRAVPRDKRVIVVPSMNPEMWFDPQFQRNVDLLNATEKYRVVCPSRGLMLSGDHGFGAQAPLEDIVAETYLALGLLAPDVEALLGGRTAVPWETEHAPKEEAADIVLVDEDLDSRDELGQRLERDNPAFRVHRFSQPGQALAWIAERPVPSLVVTELAFSAGATAHDLIEHFRRPGAEHDVPIIVTSATDRRQAGAEQLARLDVLFLPKPLNVSFAVGMIAGCLNSSRRSQASKRIRLAAGDVLFRAGEEGTELYVVEQGLLRVLKDAGDDGEVELATLGERELCGEMAFLGETTRSATVVAATDTVLVEVDSAGAQAYFARQPVWVRAMVETLIDRVRATNERVAE